MNETEEWKPVVGYEKYYLISSLGRIKSLRQNKILKPAVCKIGGYLLVNLTIGINAKSVKVHKLVTDAFLENSDNDLEVDHVDRNPKNNNVSNLRFVNKSFNSFNRKIDTRNTSGHRGVSYSKRHNKWKVRITKNGKQIYLGLFSSFERSCKIRKEAEIEYFGFCLSEEPDKDILPEIR